MNAMLRLKEPDASNQARCKWTEFQNLRHKDSIFNVQHLRYPYTFRKKLPTWADVKVPSEINRLLDCSRELSILVLTDDHG